MPPAEVSIATHAVPVSPLTLSDRLITLAKEADSAGFTSAADKLVSLACLLLDETPPQWGLTGSRH